jgi:uroporphyrinogen-III synthase
METVLLTRPKEEALKDKKIFERFGFEVIVLPLIEFEPLDFTVPPLENYDYIYFGSKRGAKFFLQKVQVLPKHLKVVTVGEKTAQFLEEHFGIKPFLVGKGSASEVVRQLKELPRGKILVPTAEKYTKDIHLLENYGFKVDILPVYETKYVEYPPGLFRVNLEKATILIFTSPSTFRAFLVNLQKINTTLLNKIIVSIGKTTKKEIEKYGYKVDWVASKPDMELLAGELSEVLNEIYKRKNFKG